MSVHTDILAENSTLFADKLSRVVCLLLMKMVMMMTTAIHACNWFPGETTGVLKREQLCGASHGYVLKLLDGSNNSVCTRACVVCPFFASIHRVLLRRLSAWAILLSRMAVAHWHVT